MMFKTRIFFASFIKKKKKKKKKKKDERLPYQMIQTGNNCATPQHEFKRYFKGAEKPIKAIF